MISKIILITVFAFYFGSGTAKAASNCPIEVSKQYEDILKKYSAYESTDTNFVMPPVFENYCRSFPAYQGRDREQMDNLKEYFDRVVAPDTIIPKQLMDVARKVVLCGDMTNVELNALSARVAKRSAKYIDSGLPHYNGKMQSMATRFMPYLASSLKLTQSMASFDADLALEYRMKMVNLVDQYYDELIRQVRVEHDLRYTIEVFTDLLQVILLNGLEYDLHDKLIQLGKALGFELQVQNRAFFKAEDITWQYLTLIDNHLFHFTPGGGNRGLNWQQTSYVARVDYVSGKLVSDEGMLATLTSPASFATKFKIEISACEAVPKLNLYLEKFGASKEMYHFETEDDEMDYPFQSILDSWSKSIFVNNNLAIFANTMDNSTATPFLALNFKTGLINRNPKVGDDIYEGPMPGMPEMKTRLKIDLYHKPK